MSTQVYVAASLSEKFEAASCAAALRGAGFTIVSSWQDLPGKLTDPSDDAERAAIVERACFEIERASVVVVLAHLGTPRGTFVEAGLALGMQKAVVWLHDGDVGRQIFDGMGRSVRFDMAGAEPNVDGLAAAITRALFR